MRNRTLYSKVFAAASILVMLVSCNGSNNKGQNNGDSRYGHIMVMNQFTPFSTLFPPMSYEGSAAQMGSQIYETLVTYSSETGELIPLLAESWEANQDHTQYTFTIRSNVFFHDNRCFDDGEGRLMEPDDVLYVMQSLCENSPYNLNASLLMDQVLGAHEFFIEKKVPGNDELTGIYLDSKDRLVFTLTHPNVEFIHVLAHYATSIYPKELKETYGTQVDDSPVGTGPFVNKNYRKNEVCLLERNPRYWGKDEDGNSLPFLDGIKLGFSTSASKVSDAMDRELLHLLVDANIVENSGRITEKCETEGSPYSLRYISDIETNFLGFLNDEGVFADKNVRLAFAYAIDRNKIIENALDYQGTPGIHGLIPPVFKGYPSDKVTSVNASADSARSYLAKAGFPGGTGFPVMSLQIQNRFKDVLVAQEIQKEILEVLGISLSITALTKDQHFARIEERKSQLWLDNWIGDFMEPQNFLNIMLSQNTPENENSFLNIYRFKNAQFDSLVGEALKVDALAARMEIYQKADQLLMDEAAIVPLYYENMQIIQHRRLKNIQDPVLGRFDFRRAYLEKKK
jgi:peptide/nickel transport system substrate-binding protein